MQKLLEGKTAVLTGCNRGIGKAILEELCKYGAEVFAVVRKRTPEFEELCESYKHEYSTEITITEADFLDEDQVGRAAKEIVGYKKNIDILINNIGIANPLNMFTMTKMDTVKETFQVNFFSTIKFTQQIARAMMRKKSGSIIFISSSAAFDGGAGMEYSASKAAIIGAARRLARECGNFNIRVNVVAPGLTDTDMGNSMSAEDEEIAKSMNIMHRKGRPKEIADAIVFLGSDMSGFITGQVLRVDGGLI
jgi:3-oxoacyl-[acyl-carrier protein] reductase